MKILKLTLNNINSLKGVHIIDFKNKNLHNKLFIISGDTGSGKSTLLDAICLALYGKTQRIKADKLRELITEGTNSSYAEVLFEIEGKQYTSKFEQKIEETNYSTNMFLSDTNKVLTKGVVFVANQIRLLLGLDFEQFSSSIVLSQGMFNRFLKSTPKEKLSLMEQFNETEVYAEISKNVYDRATKEQHKFNSMEEVLKGLTILSSDERKALESEKKILLKERQKYNLEHLIHKYNEKLEFDKLHQTTDDLKSELTALQQELMPKQLDEKHYLDFIRYLKQEQKKIEEAKLLEQESAFSQTSLNNLSNEVKKIKNELHLLDESLMLKMQKRESHYSHQKLLNKELESMENMVHLQQNYTLIVSKYQEREKAHESLRKIKELIFEEIKEEPILNKIALIEKNYFALEEKIKSQSIDKVEHDNLLIINKIAKLEEKSIVENKCIKLKKKEQNTKELLIRKKKQRDEVKEEKEELEEIIEAIENKILLEEKIINYQEERANLKEGEPCPLCGSHDHPLFSEEIKPNRTKALLLKKKKEINTLNIRYQNDEKEVIKLELSLENIQDDKEKNQKILESLEDVDGDITSLKEEQEKLSHRITTIQEQREALTKVQKQLIQSKEELLSVREQVQRQNNRQKNENEQELKLQELNHYLLNTLQMYSIPFDRQSLVLLNTKRQRYEELISNLKELSHQLNPIEGEIIQINAQKSYMEANLQSLKKRFSTQKCNLILVQQNCTALLNNNKNTDEYSEVLNKKFKEHQILYQNYTSLKEKFEIKKKTYFSNMERLEHQKRLKLLSLDKLEKEKNYVAERLSVLGQDLGVVQNKLEEDAKRLIKLEKEQNTLEEQTLIMDKWNRLNNLIGSEDGSKYQEYVQREYLNQLICKANSYLKILNHRYELDIKAEELEIEVIDLVFKSSRRGVNTLSEGESFITSLSLSFALLDLNNSSFKLDTLFLDEGFETLDDKSLKVLIDALKSFNFHTKTIGIVSHLSLLKESIPNGIKIEKQKGGVSRILIS